MPTIALNGTQLHYTDAGSGAETIVFSHGLLWSGQMFEAQIAALAPHYRCIAFDHRGQGRSAVTRAGYDMDTLTADAAGLIEALGVAPCHFVGLSMGGFVGMRLAARRPELLRSLVLLNTTADAEPPENVARYRRLNQVARWLGLRPVVGPVMSIMFGGSFLGDPDRAAQRALMRRRLLANRRLGATRAVSGVIARAAVVDELQRIRLPTLIGAGAEDVATVPAASERLRAAIPHAELVVFPGAGHTSCVEAPAAVTAAIADFLQRRAGATGV